MPTTQNPNRERDRSRHTQNPPPTDPNQRHQDRPMDDPGRGHGDKFEKHLPGNEKDQEPDSKPLRDS